MRADDRVLLHHLLEQALELSLAAAYRESADAYAVAADLAEEIGEPEMARAVRTSARGNLVLAWARKRWPTEDVRREDVELFVAAPYDQEGTVFLVRRYLQSRPLYSHEMIVSVGPKGRVRPKKYQ